MYKIFTVEVQSIDATETKTWIMSNRPLIDDATETKTWIMSNRPLIENRWLQAKMTNLILNNGNKECHIGWLYHYGLSVLMFVVLQLWKEETLLLISLFILVLCMGFVVVRRLLRDMHSWSLDSCVNWFRSMDWLIDSGWSD